MNAKYLTHLIENALDDGLEKELDTFEKELEKLSDDELRQLLPLVDINFADNSAVARDDMINVMDETTWSDFFDAYKEVTGNPFVLDLDDN